MNEYVLFFCGGVFVLLHFYFIYLLFKYRERYKSAIEKCNNFEEEVEKLKNELKIEKESKQLANQYLECLQNKSKVS
jgi:hypothetical protein